MRMESERGVAVTQADREAAASAYYAWISGNPVIPRKMTACDADGHSMVQGFARHRLAAIDECANELATYCKRMNEAGKEASFVDAHAAIRGLGKGVGE